MYFERGGGGRYLHWGWSDATMIQKRFYFVNKSLIYSINISEFVFIVAVLMNK